MMKLFFKILVILMTMCWVGITIIMVNIDSGHKDALYIGLSIFVSSFVLAEFGNRSERPI